MLPSKISGYFQQEQNISLWKGHLFFGISERKGSWKCKLVLSLIPPRPQSIAFNRNGCRDQRAIIMTDSSIEPKPFPNTTMYCYSMNHTYSINVYVFVTKYQWLHWDNKKIGKQANSPRREHFTGFSFIIFNYDLCKKHIFLHQKKCRPHRTANVPCIIIRNLLRFSFVSVVSFYRCLIFSRPAQHNTKNAPNKSSDINSFCRCIVDCFFDLCGWLAGASGKRWNRCKTKFI